MELSSFVGRRRELAALQELTAAHRLVTIVGPGGCGKTRLAREVLARRGGRGSGRTAWVDLASVREPDRVVDVTAGALGLPLGPAEDRAAALARQVGDRAVAVGIDNCEHLVRACALVTEALLSTCPHLSVLATSRQPLGVAGELVWRTPAMDEDEVVELFVQRATAARSDFRLDAARETAVRAIGRRLDGIPLAVELAAAWARALTPAQIGEALDDRLELLVGGPGTAHSRQQALVASVQWSFDLLDADAQRMLARLSVLRGRFDLDAAVAVGGSDLPSPVVCLRRLVDASMVECREHHDRTDYRLLETIRLFAAERLDQLGDGTRARDRLLEHYLARAERSASAMERDDQDAVLERLARDRESHLAALAWSHEAQHADAARRLTVALSGLWLLDGTAGEGLRDVRRALDSAPDDTSALQSELWSAFALLAMPSGHIGEIPGAARQALTLARTSQDDGALARAHIAGCYVAFYSDPGRCLELARVARQHAEAAGMDFTGDLALMFEMVALGNRDLYDEASAIAARLVDRTDGPHRRLPGAIARNLAAFGALLTGDVRRAVELARDAVRTARPLRDYFVTGTVTATLAWVLGMNGRVRTAQSLVDSLVRSVGRAGSDVDVVDLGVTVGKLLLWAGQPIAASEWLRSAAQFDDPGPDNWTSARALPSLAAALRHAGQLGPAAEAARRGVEMAQRLGVAHTRAESLDELAHLVVDDDPGSALDGYHEALAIRRARGLRTHLADSLDHVARVALRREEHETAARLFAASGAARAQSGYPRPAIDVPTHQRDQEALRQALGPDALALAEAEGAALDLDRALDDATRSRGPRGRPATGWASLTPTELQVIDLVVEGLTNPEIAARLFVSRSTVKAHLSHVFTKLGVANRSELAALAARHVVG